MGDGAPAPLAPRVTAGLQRRLLVLLLLPLVLLALVNAWFDYRSADSSALQLDRELLRMVPLLADSVFMAEGPVAGRPVLLLAPVVEEFLKSRPGTSAVAFVRPAGAVLFGDAWLASALPSTREPEFRSEENGGITFRIVSQRVQTVAGELVVQLADGSDPRQQWARAVLFKVLLPNLVLILAAAFAVNWAVHRALKPLIDLKEDVERRSPRDLSAIDEQASPEEVRPLVQSLNRLFGLVNAQAESQRRFVADAAHQLRTPLAGLQAQVEAWAQMVHIRKASGGAATDPPGSVTLGAEQIYRLRSATRRTSQLANQLLALSRADAQAMSAQPTQLVDLQGLCENVLAIHLDAATARRLDLGLDAQPQQVMGHEWLLRELLANLVDNAVKYTPPGGCVTIRCGGGESGPMLEVEDDGPGISPQEIPRVTERFYRVPGTQGEGTGLGLAIASEIARVHRATLSLKTPPNGRGLAVRLQFGAPPRSEVS